MAKGGFRGGMGGGNMMKQAQKMQEEFMKMQQELESKEFTSTVGGGAVKATMIGTRALKSIEIDPSGYDRCRGQRSDHAERERDQRGNEQAHPHGLSVLKNENLAPSKEDARFFCADAKKRIRKRLESISFEPFWSEWRDLNPRHPAPKLIGNTFSARL